MAKRKLGQLPKEDREPIWNKVKAYYEVGLKFDEIVDNIEHYYQVSISKGQISTRAKNDNWVKSKNEQITYDIIDFEKKNEQINEQKKQITNKLALLSDFEITTIDEIIRDKERLSTLVTSTASLALIRTNQALTKNTKQVAIKVTEYSNGKPSGQGIEFVEMEMDMQDYKNASDAIDKLSITTNINQRHSNSQVNVTNTNATQNNIEINKDMIIETLESFENEY